MQMAARADYHTDFYAWCMEQAKFLEHGEFEKDLLKESPSLQPKIQENFSDFWEYGVAKAQQEAGLLDFPSSPIWTIDDILDDGFYPRQDSM